MMALVMEAPKSPVTRDVREPACGLNDVVIAVKRCGICGTDLHIYDGDFLSSYPLVPGHEFSGVVAAVGEAVTEFAPGDRVAVDPNLLCGRCDYCRTQRGNHCRNWGAIGGTRDGAMAEYVVVPAANVFSIPDSMSFAEAAWIEPVACVVHGMQQLSLRPGRRVLVFGVGSIGQLLVQALARSGASELAVVDVSRAKLDLALEYGATAAFQTESAEMGLAHRRRHNGFDAVVDATGIPSVIQSSFQYLAPGGTHLQFGVAPRDAQVLVSPFDIYHNDWRLIGSMAINLTYQAARDWIAAGRFRLRELISAEVRLEDLPAFFHREKNKDQMKVQVTME